MPDAAAYQLIGTDTGVASGSNASISWPDRADSTEYEWYAVANDGTTTTTSSTWSFTTAAANQAPVVSDIPNQTIAEGASFTTISLDDYVSDVDNTDGQMTWTFSGNTALNVSIVNRVATISIPNADWNGSETLTFRATDPGALYDEDAATFTVTAVNDAPVLAAIGAKSVAESSELSFTATATDVDLPAQILTFSLMGAPTGAVIDGSTGAFTWTPTEAQVGEHTFTVKVCDDGSPVLCDEEEITVTVTWTLAHALVYVQNNTTLTGDLAADGDVPGEHPGRDCGRALHDQLTDDAGERLAGGQHGQHPDHGEWHRTLPVRHRRTDTRYHVLGHGPV